MLAFLVLAILLSCPGHFAWAQESPQTPEIKSQQQPEGGLEIQKNNPGDAQSDRQPLTRIPQAIPEGAEGKRESYPDERTEQGNEFWPPFYGYRLKVTDTLLVFVTFLLFVSTYALWRSTRRLVKGAQVTAERQLRAYVHVKDVVISEMNSGYDPNIHVVLKNYGQTPARQIINTFKCRPMAQPNEPAFKLLEDVETVELPDLAPGQIIHSAFTIPHNWWSDLKPHISNKTTTFYVFGRIDYRDIFSKDVRVTEYRFYLIIGATGIPNEQSLVMYSRAGNRTA
jgi:hypothetical protein